MSTMAIRPQVVYPSQVTAGDPLYPHGKAQNLTVPGDGTGTPLERTWLNDLWGFLQALLEKAQVVPSGLPDTSKVSQYREAIFKYIIGASEETRVLPVPITGALFVDPAQTIYSHSGVGGSFAVWDVVFTSNDDDFAWFGIPFIPDFGRIKSVTARVRGASGHSNLPSTKPNVALIYEPLVDGGGAAVVVNSASDPSASVGAYEQYHDITLSGLVEDILPGMYWIRVQNETGADSLAGLRIGGLSVGFSKTPTL